VPYTIIALVGNKIVGFCDFNKSSFPELSKGEIYTLYVIEKSQGCGIGKNLVKKAAEQLQIKDLIPFIAVAFEKNEKAAMFYKKLGFKNIRSIDSKIDNKLYKEIIYLNNLDENLI
jgi:ribosomal protein S18 acetylase RimI-like enzyme